MICFQSNSKPQKYGLLLGVISENQPRQQDLRTIPMAYQCQTTLRLNKTNQGLLNH